MTEYGIKADYKHDYSESSKYQPRYLATFAERGDANGVIGDQDPFWIVSGPSGDAATDGFVKIGIADGTGSWPDIGTAAYIKLENGKVTANPGIVLNPTTTTLAPDTKGSLMYDSGTDELKYYDGSWQIISAGGLSAHALDGVYHTAEGLTEGWVLSADSPTTFSWKAPTGGGADPDAIHDNVADEITAITPKTTLGSTDEFVLEDGGASFVKKAVTFANIESSISLANLGTRTHASLSDAPADAHHVAFVLADFTTAFAAESLANLTTRTHASLSDAPTSAHHVRYADSEAESVITAEIVDGQSIDNAIDALILTHKNLATAHQDAPALITTHASDDNAHHEVFESSDFTTAFAAESLANLTTRAHSDLSDAPTDAHHTEVHVLSGSDHTAAGLTVGWVISADSATTFSWKAPSVTDDNAIHDNVANEITAIVPKTTLVAADEFILEDSEASGVKKAVTFGNIEASASLANLGTRTHASLSDAPTDAHHSETHTLAVTGPHTGTLPLIDLAVGTRGSIIRRGAGDWEEFGMGSTDYVLKVGALDVEWGLVNYDELGGTQPAPVAHNLIDTTGHPVSSLTPGHFIKADSATTYSFQAHGLSAGDVGAYTTAETDSAIDTDISTHADIPAAHHVVYLDSDAVAAVVAEDPLTLTNDLTVGGGNLGIARAATTVGTLIPALEIYNRGAGVLGPHVHWYTSADSTHPRAQMYFDIADSMGLSFDAYYNGSNWISSDAGSSFQMYKLADELRFRYDTAAIGGTITWNNGIVLDASGNVTIGNTLTATINAGIADYDAFLVSDSGLIKFRTGAEAYSDMDGYVTADFTTDFAAESLANLTTRTHASLSDAPADAHHVAFVLSNFTTAFAAESLANLTTRAHSNLSDAPDDAHHNKVHALVDATNHPESGLTNGHFLKATGTTTYAFGAHGLVASDVGASPAFTKTQWTLPVFDTSTTIGDSMVSQNSGGTELTVDGDLIANNLVYEGEYVSLSEGINGEQILRVPYINNVLFSAEKRFTIVKTGTTIAYNPVYLFDGNISNYTGLQIADGQVVTLNFDLDGKSEFGNLVYPYGYLYIHVYYTYLLDSVKARLNTTNGGTLTWRTWRDGVNISNDAGRQLWAIRFDGNYTCEDMEIEFTASGSDAWISEIEWNLDRNLEHWAFAVVQKMTANNLYGNLRLKDSSNVTKIEMTTAGAMTLAGNLTAANIVTAGNVDGVDVSDFKTAYDAHDGGDVETYHTNYYTDTDVESVITAELVDGQSIDNAIDALISTHNVADNHIAHSGVTITAGTGLSGGGTIAADRTINCDITQYTNALAIAAVIAENPLALTNALKIGGDSIEDSTGAEMIGFTGAGFIDFFGGQGTPSNQDVLTWSTTNSRWEVAAQSGGGGITGSGTNNVLTKWLVGGSTIQDSIISDDGSIATVSGALDVTGDIDLSTTGALRVDGSDDRRIMYFSGSPNRGIRYDAKGPSAGWYGEHRFYASYNAGALALIATIGTTGIVLAAGTGVNEFSTDGTLGGNSDNAVPTEQAVKEYIDKHNNIGSGNSDWINCPYEGAEFVDGDRMRYAGSMQAFYVSGAGRYIYSVPLPTTRGGKSLFINGTRVSLSDADSSNRVYETNLYGMGNTTGTELDSDTTNKNSINLWEDTSMGNVNLGGYDVAKVVIKTAVATAGSLKVQYVTVRYYYA